MAEENEEQANPEQQLEGLEKKLKLLNYLSYAGIAITLIIAIVIVVWISLISSQIEKDTPMDTEQIEQNLGEVDKRLASIYERIDTQQGDMDKITEQIKALEEKHNNRQVDIIQRILINQQRDYGEFLKTMEYGMDNLAGMVKGSRDWSIQYDKRLKDAQKIAKERIKQIENLEVANPGTGHGANNGG